MTERPMDAGSVEHPDEGSIHAWLDGALSAAEAERLAAHVQSCAECQARVAEARGLIAGASRIVGALDDAPAGARPQWARGDVVNGGAAGVGQAAPSEAPMPRGSAWRWLRVTPGRAALAATILVAVGITLTYQRGAIDVTTREMASVLDPRRTDVPATTSPEGSAREAAKPRDDLLDSAVAKNVTIAQGRRAIGAAPGPSVPAAPPPATTIQPPAVAGARAVARGRASVEAQRESTTAVADRFQLGGARRVDAPAAVVGEVAADPRAAAPTSAGMGQGGARMAEASSDAVARTCVLVDSPEPDARWADQPFPLVIAIDSGASGARRNAAVLTVVGEPTQLRASWAPRGDSVLVRLGRIGYSGSIALGPGIGARSGIAISAVAPTTLEQTVAEPSAAARAAAPRPQARKAEAGAQPAPAPGPPLRQLRVTARVVACPAR